MKNRTSSRAGSFTPGKGYRKTIGHRMENGKLKPCRFWLGLDEREATAKGLKIEAILVSLPSSHWTPEALREAEGIRRGGSVQNAPQSTADVPAMKIASVASVVSEKEADRESPSFRDGLKRYREWVLGNPAMTCPMKNSLIIRSRQLERSPLADLPLHRIGPSELTETIGYWLRCPISPKLKRKIAPYTARMLVGTLRMAMDWMDLQGLWTAPRRFERLFRLPRSVNPPKVSIIPVDDLRKLYNAAEGDMEAIFLLTINCGFCTSELASLKRSEIDLTAGYIRRSRQKTQVFASWKLWPETIQALLKSMAKPNDLDLAFLTSSRTPLMRYKENGVRIDCTCLAWPRRSPQPELRDMGDTALWR